MFSSVLCQISSAGYPTNTARYLELQRSRQSYIRFQNVIDHTSDYLASFTYEIYLRLLPTESGNGLTGVSYLIDCTQFAQMTISQDRLQFWMAGGNTCEYRFDTASKEFQNRFLNKWVHYSISYSNFSLSLNQQLGMRIFVNGLLAQLCRIRNAPQVSLSLGRGLCVIGNSFEVAQRLAPGSTPSATSDSALSAHLGYFQVSSVPRQTNYTISPFHFPPATPPHPSLLMRFDSLPILEADYYLNRTVHNLTVYRVVALLSAQEPPGLCEACYGQPMHVLTVRRSNMASNLMPLRMAPPARYAIEFWFKVWESQGAMEAGEVVRVAGVISIRVGGNVLEIQVGDEKIWREAIGRQMPVLLHMQWTQIVIQVQEDSAIVYRNGEKVSVITHDGRWAQNQTNTTLVVRPNPFGRAVTASLWRIRMINDSVTEEWVRQSFLNGSNNQFRKNQALSMIFDFVFTDVYMSSSTPSSTQSPTSTRPLLTSATFFSPSNASHVLTFLPPLTPTPPLDLLFDLTLCGTPPPSPPPPSLLYLHGLSQQPVLCSASTWAPSFVSNTTRVMSAWLRAVGPEVTYELWVRPYASITGVILEAAGGRVRLEVAAGQMGYGGTWTRAGGQVESVEVRGKLGWQHVVWQTSNREGLTRMWVGQTSKVVQGATYEDSLASGFSNVVLGNNPKGERPFFGSIKELRIWNEFRSEESINRFMHLEIGSEFRKNLLHYFRFSGDTEVLRITDFLNSSGAFDFTSPNLQPYDSPLRFEQDTADPLHICPFSPFSQLYPANDSCIPATQLAFVLVAYLDTQANLLVIETSTPPEIEVQAFNFSYSLVSVKSMIYQQVLSQREQTQIIAARRSLFAMRTGPRWTIERYKVDGQYQYQVEVEVRNKYYIEQPLTKSRTLLDPKCPEIEISNLDPVNKTVTLWMNATSRQVNSRIDLFPYVPCLASSTPFFQGLQYSWTALDSIQSLTLRTTNATNLTLQLTGLSPTTPFRLNVSLVYNNTLQGRLSLILEVITIKATTNPLVIIVTTPTGLASKVDGFLFWTSQDLILNASQTHILHPSFQKRAVRYAVDCPRELFKSQSDYAKWCFITFQGVLDIPKSAGLQVVPQVRYPFVIRASVRQAEDVNTSHTIYVRWESLTPAQQKCPDVQLPALYNISKHNSNEVRVFPQYYLNCQRDGGYIARYHFANITWRFFLNESTTEMAPNNQLIEYRDNRTWGIVRENAKQILMPGDRVRILIQYSLNSEVAPNGTLIEVLTEVCMIESEFRLQVKSNSPNMTFKFNETMSIDIRGTLDPENPSNKLTYVWQCPDQAAQKTFCPSQNQLQLSFSTEARIAFLWKYSTTNYLYLRITNLKTNKSLPYMIPFTLDLPPVTPGVSLCPFFDLSGQLPRNFTDDTYLLEITNNYTDRVISSPTLHLKCSQTFTLVALHALDSDNLTVQRDRSLMASFPLRLGNLRDLEPEREYVIPVFMYYKATSNAGMRYYRKDIRVVRRSWQENRLIAEFARPYIEVRAGSKEVVEVSAKRSRDEKDANNRSFQYRWECGRLVPAGLCPKNQSQITITPEIRNKFGIDIPGRLYEFKVQIFDHNRTSDWTSCLLFISPHSSPTCLTLTSPHPPPPTLLSPSTFYQSLTLTSHCPNLTLTSLTSTSNASLTFSPSYTPPSTLPAPLTLLLALTITEPAQAQVTYTAAYSIMEAYRASTSLNYSVQIVRRPAPLPVHRLQAQSIVNFYQGQELLVKSNEVDSKVARWECSGALTKICQGRIGNELRISEVDLEVAERIQMAQQGQMIRVTAHMEDETQADKWIQVTDKDDYQKYQSCQIRTNQEVNGYVEVDRPLAAGLQCGEGIIGETLVLWTLQEQPIQFHPIPVSPPYLSSILIKPHTLDPHRTYTLSATLPQHYTFSLTLNTSTPLQPLPLALSLSPPSGGPLYRTPFTLSLTPNNTSSSNLFTTLHLLDLEDQWLPLAPWALLNLDKVIKFTLPQYKRLRLEARDELGRYHAGDIQVDTWLEGGAGDSTRSWEEAVEEVGRGGKVGCAEVRRRCTQIRQNSIRTLNKASQRLRRLNQTQQKIGFQIVKDLLGSQQDSIDLFWSDPNLTIEKELQSLMASLGQSNFQMPTFSMLLKNLSLNLPDSSPIPFSATLRGHLLSPRAFTLTHQPSMTLTFPQMTYCSAFERAHYLLTENQTKEDGYISLGSVSLQFLNSQFEELDYLVQPFQVTYSNLSQEEYENGTCSKLYDGKWNFKGMLMDKNVTLSVTCTIVNHSKRQTYALLILDSQTGLPKHVASGTQKNNEEIKELPVAMVAAMSCVALVFVFIQILSIYADCQQQKYSKLINELQKKYDRIDNQDQNQQIEISRFTYFKAIFSYKVDILNVLFLRLPTIPFLIRAQLAQTAILSSIASSTLAFLAWQLTPSPQSVPLFSLFSALLLSPLSLLLRAYHYSRYHNQDPSSSLHQTAVAYGKPTAPIQDLPQARMASTNRSILQEPHFTGSDRTPHPKGPGQLSSTQQTRGRPRIESYESQRPLKPKSHRRVQSSQVEEGAARRSTDNNEESKGIFQEAIPAKEVKPGDQEKSFSFKLANPFEHSYDGQQEESLEVNEINIQIETPPANREQVAQRGALISLINFRQQISHLPQLARRVDDLPPSEDDYQTTNHHNPHQSFGSQVPIRRESVNPVRELLEDSSSSSGEEDKQDSIEVGPHPQRVREFDEALDIGMPQRYKNVKEVNESQTTGTEMELFEILDQRPKVRWLYMIGHGMIVNGGLVGVILYLWSKKPNFDSSAQATLASIALTLCFGMVYQAASSYFIAERFKKGKPNDKISTILMGGKFCMGIFKEEILKPVIEKKLRKKKGAQKKKEDLIVNN